MVIIKKEQVNNIPLLHVVKEKSQQDALPLVMFIHGFTSAKEHNLHYAYLLAEKGFRVIMPEALYHGERENGYNEKELAVHFWKVVLTAIHEINDIKEYYLQNQLADAERIGIVGTSMGGIITMGALAQYPWIKAAVSLMGMPAYEKFSQWQLDQLKRQGYTFPLTEEEINDQLAILRDYDLSLHHEKLQQRPLLFWHAKNDSMVPYDFAYQFFKKVEPNYQNSPEKLKFISDEHAGHKVTREGLKATVAWFEKFL